VKVERIEVKRCLVASDEGKSLGGLVEQTFQNGFTEIEKEVLKLTEMELDNRINWRAREYDKLVWAIEERSIDDLGVWPEAGELPAEWCYGSVRDTAQCIERALKSKKWPKESVRGRAFKNIPFIKKNTDILVRTRLLAPIVVPGGTHRKYPPYHLMTGDLDDGCLRAISFALKGIEKFNVFVGTST